MSNKLNKSFINQSISHGTLNQDHLYPVFIKFLEHHQAELGITDKVKKIKEEWAGADEDTRTDILNEDIFDLMDEIAPEGTYFQSNEGDGSDFGFWKFSDEDEENEGGDDFAKGGFTSMGGEKERILNGIENETLRKAVKYLMDEHGYFFVKTEKWRYVQDNISAILGIQADHIKLYFVVSFFPEDEGDYESFGFRVFTDPYTSEFDGIEGFGGQHDFDTDEKGIKEMAEAMQQEVKEIDERVQRNREEEGGDDDFAKGGKTKKKLTPELFFNAAAAYLKKHYSLYPNDMDLSVESVTEAANDGQDPSEYIDAYARKHDLDKTSGGFYEQGGNTGDVKYASIVFFQGHEAEEPLRILDEDGSDAALKYMQQWDDGDYYDIRSDDGGGTSDRRISIGDYVITYNSPLGYIGLSKKLKPDEYAKGGAVKNVKSLFLANIGKKVSSFEAEFSSKVDYNVYEYLKDELGQEGYVVEVKSLGYVGVFIHKVFSTKDAADDFAKKKAKSFSSKNVEAKSYAKGGKVDRGFETSNLYLKGSGLDVNGNYVVRVSFPNDKAFSIQTNGVLPHTQRAMKAYDNISDIPQAEMLLLEKEVNDYVKAYGSANQKKRLRIYNSSNSNEEFAKGGNPKSNNMSNKTYSHGSTIEIDQKMFRVKLDGGTYLAEKRGEDSYDNYYTRGEAIKKARVFNGKIELAQPNYAMTEKGHSEVVMYFDTLEKAKTFNRSPLPVEIHKVVAAGENKKAWGGPAISAIDVTQPIYEKGGLAYTDGRPVYFDVTGSDGNFQIVKTVPGNEGVVDSGTINHWTGGKNKFNTKEEGYRALETMLVKMHEEQPGYNPPYKKKYDNGGAIMPDDVTQSMAYDNGGITGNANEAEVLKNVKPGDRIRYAQFGLVQSVISSEPGSARFMVNSPNQTEVVVYANDILFVTKPARGNHTTYKKDYRPAKTIEFNDGGAVAAEVTAAPIAPVAKEVPRIPNQDAKIYSENKLAFTGTCLEGKMLEGGNYVVMDSYCYPLWFFDAKNNCWYGNSDAPNKSTQVAIRFTSSRPAWEVTMLPTMQLLDKIMEGTPAYDLGGMMVKPLYPEALGNVPTDNTTIAHGNMTNQIP